MEKLLIKNRRASHEYEILERFECGVVLSGHEVKSLKSGGGNLNGSFVSFKENAAWVNHLHIPLYAKATIEAYDADRPKKLLLRKAEIQKLASALNTKGVTVVPTSCYAKNGRVKLEIALARGKKNYDKREDLKKRSQEMSIKRAIANL